MKRQTDSEAKSLSSASDNAAERYCYIARDGSPGAYAICVDDPLWAKQTAQTVAGWIKDGATVERLPIAQAIAEIDKWERPAKRRAPESPDLFAALEENE